MNEEPEEVLASANAVRSVNLWCVACHLSTLLSLVGIPFINIWAPIIIWEIKKNEIPEVVLHAKESLNFQITATIVFIIITIGIFMGFILTSILIGFIILPIFGLMMLVAAIAWLTLVILASVKANEGKEYRYPFILRLVR